MADDERRAEIEAVARAWWAHDPAAFDSLDGRFRQLQLTRAEAVIAALDRVRDARGDEAPRISDEDAAALDALADHPKPGKIGAARSPQGEDHEAAFRFQLPSPSLEDHEAGIEAVARWLAATDGHPWRHIESLPKAERYRESARGAIAAYLSRTSPQGEDRETSDAVRGDLHGTPDEWPERQPTDPDRGQLRDAATPASGRGRQSEHDVERLQAAIDKAYGAMNSSTYVGGPSEREAWQTAMTALGGVVTQHTGTSDPKRRGRDG